MIKLAIFNLSSALNSFIPLDDWIDTSTEELEVGCSTNRTTFVALGTYLKCISYDRTILIFVFFLLKNYLFQIDQCAKN